ncbi:putative transcription factor interactor and regulator LIM family [Lupinus albus]|uniref:Putative transcription factor interactor and regulator LIM family n=1 Tax=Lupinus albus TaxID=3870 RepID=A0A6A4PQP2_LUPAL|nr:putative transcription factor interactor and regulator LIM family [Lupinus albus]
MQDSEREHREESNIESEYEQLARGIFGNGNIYPPVQTHFTTESRNCGGCNTEIHYGRYLTCFNASWHPKCLICRACNQPIYDNEFSIFGNYPYHSSCYKDYNYLKCDVCEGNVITNYAGHVGYMTRPFFMQKICTSHIHDGTPICFSCERMESRERGGYSDLYDGRKLCLECKDSAIMDTKECQSLYIEIQKFYENLHMNLDLKIPLLLVERQELIKVVERINNGNNDIFEPRGICLFSEKVTINTITRGPEFETGNRASSIRTKPRKLTRRPCGVTAILIVFGLPRLLTGSIIAHEMMHAWLHSDEGYHGLSDEVEEGICQFMAHMWLEAKRPHYESKLWVFFKFKIEQNTIPAYGDGFRAARQAVYKYGLHQTLQHIRTTGNFPF